MLVPWYTHFAKDAMLLIKIISDTQAMPHFVFCCSLVHPVYFELAALPPQGTRRRRSASVPKVPSVNLAVHEAASLRRRLKVHPPRRDL